MRPVARLACIALVLLAPAAIGAIEAPGLADTRAWVYLVLLPSLVVALVVYAGVRIKWRQ